MVIQISVSSLSSFVSSTISIIHSELSVYSWLDSDWIWELAGQQAKGEQSVCRQCPQRRRPAVDHRDLRRVWKLRVLWPRPSSFSGTCHLQVVRFQWTSHPVFERKNLRQSATPGELTEFCLLAVQWAFYMYFSTLTDINMTDKNNGITALNFQKLGDLDDLEVERYIGNIWVIANIEVCTRYMPNNNSIPKFENWRKRYQKLVLGP